MPYRFSLSSRGQLRHRTLSSCPAGPVPSAPEPESWLRDEED